MQYYLLCFNIVAFLAAAACRQAGVVDRSKTDQSYGSSESLLSYTARDLKARGLSPELITKILAQINLEKSGTDPLETLTAALDAALAVVMAESGIDTAAVVKDVFASFTAYYFLEKRSQAEATAAMQAFNNILLTHLKGVSDADEVSSILAATIKETSSLAAAAGVSISYADLAALNARAIVSLSQSKVLSPSQTLTQTTALGKALAALLKEDKETTTAALSAAKAILAAMLDEAKPIASGNAESVGNMFKGFTAGFASAYTSGLSSSKSDSFKTLLQEAFDNLVEDAVSAGDLTSSSADIFKTKVTLVPRTSYSVVLDADADYTALTTVDLTLAATDAAEMYVTNTSGCASGGSWETYSTSKTGWTIAQTNATASVYVKFRDAKSKESECVSDSITQDSTVPLTPSLDITAQVYSGSLTVTASQNATPDAHFKEFRYRLDNTVPTSCSDGTASAGSIGITGTSNITMKVIACDYAGNKSAAAVTGTYTYNHPPVASGGSETLGEDDGATPITLAYTDADADDATSCGIVASPSHGSLGACACVTGTCTVSFTPTANYSGSDSFTYRVNDGYVFSAAATLTLTITAANDAPVATGGSITINEDASATTLTLPYTDADTGDAAVSCATVSGVSHGVLGACSCASGVCTRTYTPTANYAGSDSFTYKVNDGDADSAAGTFNITITAVNDAPVLATNAGASLAVGDTTTITTSLLSATDVDHGDASITFTVSTLPTRGLLKKSGTTLTSGQSFTEDDIANSLITYVHTAGDDTDDSFVFNIKDSANAYATGATVASPATFTLTVSTTSAAPTDWVVSASNAGMGDAGHACAIISGVTYCWGDQKLSPVAVSLAALTGGESSFKSLTSGYKHACALTSSGKAYCWGDDTYGQLGNGATAAQTSPYPVDTSGLTGGETTFKSLSAGSNFTCGITTLGKGYCWGADGSGQLGNGATATDQASPSAIDTSTLNGESTFISIDAGYASACAITSLGKAFCWGTDNNGLLGNGAALTASQVSPSPVDVTTLSGGESTFKFINTGTNAACAVTTNDKVYCWGADNNGNLGNGAGVTATQDSPYPVTMTSLTGGETTFSSISMSVYQACAVTPLGKPYCWGNNSSGELGLGVAGNYEIPTPVDTSGISGAKTFKQIAAGFVSTSGTGRGFSCGVTTDNKGFCWGWETNAGTGSGTLGNGSVTGSKDVPTALDLAPMSISFLDTDPTASEIAGVLTINKAADETNITHYVLYWGLSTTGKENMTPIATIAVTGANVTHTFAADTAKSINATHLLVFAKNGAIEADPPAAIEIYDYTASGCSGYSHGGYCWYYGSFNESCTAVCAGHGGYNATGTEAFGSNGGSPPCINILLPALDAGIVSNNPGQCWNGKGLGCYTYENGGTIASHCTSVSTSETDFDGDVRRACACNL